ncbi:MAG: hypothetical protein ACLSGF_13215 [Alistipes onderdonkii]
MLLPSRPARLLHAFLQDKLNWLDSLNEHLLNNTALIGTAIGLIFIGFAREHNEDEMITSYAAEQPCSSAVYANYIILIAAGTVFLRLRVPDLHVRTACYTIPADLLPAVFRMAMYRLNKTRSADEE